MCKLISIHLLRIGSNAKSKFDFFLLKYKIRLTGNDEIDEVGMTNSTE